MRFFEPSRKFINWLASYANGRLIADVGCGEGHVTKALLAKKAKVIGIEPMADIHTGMANCILPMEAQRCRLLKQEGILAIFCRPCHNNFVAETIDVLHPTSEALYISKPSNLPIDLENFDYEEVREAPPCKVEKVFRVNKPITSVKPQPRFHDLERMRRVMDDLRMQLSN